MCPEQRSQQPPTSSDLPVFWNFSCLTCVFAQSFPECNKEQKLFYPEHLAVKTMHHTFKPSLNNTFPLSFSTVETKQKLRINI